MATTDLRADARASSTYDRAAKALHWLIVALLSIQFVTALLLPDIKVDTVPDTVINLHFSFGILILSSWQSDWCIVGCVLSSWRPPVRHVDLAWPRGAARCCRALPSLRTTS
jgi:cytochrome b561